MDITVIYGSGRKYGVAASTGAGVLVKRHSSDKVQVTLLFTTSCTTGDMSWQADHFGNDASCNRAELHLEPEIALRLAKALITVAEGDSGEKMDGFRATVDSKFERVDGRYTHIVKTHIQG